MWLLAPRLLVHEKNGCSRSERRYKPVEFELEAAVIDEKPFIGSLAGRTHV